MHDFNLKAIAIHQVYVDCRLESWQKKSIEHLQSLLDVVEDLFDDRVTEQTKKYYTRAQNYFPPQPIDFDRMRNHLEIAGRVVDEQPPDAWARLFDELELIPILYVNTNYDTDFREIFISAVEREYG